MKWFGSTWNAPINEMTDHAPVPVGEHCDGCSKPIKKGERGVIIPTLGEEDPVPYHLDCFMKSILGR